MLRWGLNRAEMWDGIDDVGSELIPNLLRGLLSVEY